MLALEKHGLTPASGPVVVTGAAGGVGSVATAVLSKLGYHVIASTGRMSEADYLKGLGAAEVIDRAELAGSAKPGPWVLPGAHRAFARGCWLRQGDWRFEPVGKVT